TLPLTFSFPAGVLDMFCHQVTRTPQNVALCDDSGHWNYQELDNASARVAADIDAAGIEPGKIVTVLGSRDTFLVIAMLAALKARTPFCILDSAYPHTRLTDQIDVLRPAGLLALPACQPGTEILDAHSRVGCN